MSGGKHFEFDDKDYIIVAKTSGANAWRRRYYPIVDWTKEELEKIKSIAKSKAMKAIFPLNLLSSWGIASKVLFVRERRYFSKSITDKAIKVKASPYDFGVCAVCGKSINSRNGASYLTAHGRFHTCRTKKCRLKIRPFSQLQWTSGEFDDYLYGEKVLPPSWKIPKFQAAFDSLLESGEPEKMFG